MNTVSRQNKHIVFLGDSRFPHGFASVQRMILMGKALLSQGFNVTVLCRKGSWNKNQFQGFEPKGRYEGIDYVYTSGSVHKPSGFVNRNIQKIYGIYGEYKHLRLLRKSGKIDMAILYNRDVFHVARYLFFAAIFKFPVVLNLVEMASSMQHKASLVRKINNYLFDKLLIRFFDGALPISNRLLQFYNTKAPSKPAVKIPIICDFDRFKQEKDDNHEPYFLYCGSVDYIEVRDFVIESYSALKDKKDYKLYMIISSENKERVQGLEKELQKYHGTKNIRVFSNIPYEKLVDLYCNAKALLIPLRNTLQDTSRFPHKIGEYLASGNPVITTNVGEIKVYFDDFETGLVADSYDVPRFSEKMQYVIDGPSRAVEIGEKGQALGFEHFDYRTLGVRMKTFIDSY